MTLSQLSVIAFLVETLLQTIKPIYDKEKGWQIDQVAAIIIGILICVGTDIDVFKLVDIPMHIPYLGPVLTGIIVSRGSNIMHDIIKYLQGLGASMDAPADNRAQPVG